jgi:hypothetical protein
VACMTAVPGNAHNSASQALARFPTLPTLISARPSVGARQRSTDNPFVRAHGGGPQLRRGHADRRLGFARSMTLAETMIGRTSPLAPRGSWSWHGQNRLTATTIM